MRRAGACGVIFLGALLGAFAASAQTLTVGSKKFTESVILGEIAVQLLRANGITAEHRRELGGTRVLWNALLGGEIDVYPEYTGTLMEELLAQRRIASDAELHEALSRRGIAVAGPLGFNNTYILGMKEEAAAARRIKSISDLAAHPQLRFGFSNEFMDRGDGWVALQRYYGLPQRNVRGLDHDLAYRGLQSGGLDVIDLYATDAEIRYYHIRSLEDDRHFFPAYRALILYRADLASIYPGAMEALAGLGGRIDEQRMIAMNAAVKIDGQQESRVAARFIESEFGVPRPRGGDTRFSRLLRNTADHLALVAVSLGAAIAVAIPLGILSVRRPRIGQIVLGAAGIIQTIPSLALLVFMIPLLGIGGPPAVAALFFYSLLPIIRNTHSGLHDIPVPILESAVAIGLPSSARLRLVELPLAARSILSGIKTSAVINVGTATLGALIGAGGYGQPILTGIRLDDIGLILEGAVPAAGLALIVQGMFDAM
ncbi:MAG: ABC transporter permease subunit, partial [Gammaproteobacteria bacterium]|nr:ABC transporter permease subunit [Gammaproteobacteria bacterium]